MVEVATKAEEAKEADVAEVEVELPEDTVTLEILLNTRDCAVI